MLFFPILAALVDASPPKLATPDSTRAECLPALESVANCLWQRSSAPLPIAGDSRLQVYKDSAACKAETCCKDGEPFNIYNSCAVCKNVDCTLKDQVNVPNPAAFKPINAGIKKIRQVANRCQLCQATYLSYKNQGDCNTAMNKMCSTYCRGECDFDCACRIHEAPSSIHSCVVLGGKECVLR